MKLIRKIVLYATPAMVLALPYVVLAQASDVRNTGIGRLINLVGTAIRDIIPIIIGLAVLVFLWGVLKYVIAKDEDSQKEARNVMLWGIIAIFVMVSVWGLVNVLSSTLQLNNNIPNSPGLPSPGGSVPSSATPQ